jgi:microcystin degradation protein MlrC
VLKELSSYAFEHRRQGNVLDPPIDEVMEKVKSIEGGPILLVEPADNVGGGAAGDGTGVLRAMLKFGITNSAVVINDPAAVAQLAEVPIHGTARVAIGGTANPFDEGPVALDVVLKSTSNGQFELEDRNSHLASMLGVHVDMGPCAVVEHAGITVLLTSRKTPPFDLGQWRSQGIAPERLRVIGVKAAVAHRRAYDPIAKASFRVDTPGPCSSDLRRFPYRHVPRPIYPLDQTP